MLEVIRANRKRIFSFLVMSLFDGPRDGHWALGLVTGIMLKSSYEARNARSCERRRARVHCSLLKLSLRYKKYSKIRYTKLRNEINAKGDSHKYLLFMCHY